MHAPAQTLEDKVLLLQDRVDRLEQELCELRRPANGRWWASKAWQPPDLNDPAEAKAQADFERAMASHRQADVQSPSEETDGR